MRISQYQKLKNYRQNRKKRLVRAFGGHCANCKLEDHPVAFDFHHIDPSVKEGLLTSELSNKAWSKVIAEAKKCMMLCAICHRKYHAGLIELPTEYFKFDESLLEIQVRK